MRSMFALRCKLTGQRMVKPHAATTSDDLLALSKVLVFVNFFGLTNCLFFRSHY